MTERPTRAAKALVKMLELTEEAGELVQSPRWSQEFVGGCRVIQDDVLAASRLLETRERISAEQAGRSFAVITHLVTTANLAMEMLAEPDVSRIAQRYNALLSQVVEAHTFFIALADELSVETAAKWCAGYPTVTAGIEPETRDTPATTAKRLPIARDLRALIWAKSGGHCWYCGVQTNPFDNFHVDHFIPVADGGTNEAHNLVPACQRCNGEKGAKHVEAFRAARGGGLFWFEIVRGGKP